jgi:hypothetical protein
MNAKEELTNLLMESYNKGVADAKAAAEEAVPKVVDAAIAAERKANSRARAGKPRQLPRIGTGALHAEQQCCFAMGWKEGAAAVRAAIRARGTNHG